MKKIILLFTLFSVLLTLSSASWASLSHEVTVITTEPTSKPVAHPTYNAWIFAAPDPTTGTIQIYAQVLRPAANLTPKPTRIQLTSSTTFNKYAPLWGGTVNFINYYTSASDTTPDVCIGGDIYYYLGDGDGTGKKNIYAGCITGLTTASPVVVLQDVKLTGITASNTYDVGDYDASTLATAEYLDPSGINTNWGYPIVFTDENQKLHTLFLSSIIWYGDSSFLTTGYLVHDYEGGPTSSGYRYRWTSFVASQTNSYFQPRFNSMANKITFTFTTSMSSVREVGIINQMARSEKRLTNIGRSLANPQFETLYDRDIVFEVMEDTDKGRIAHLQMGQDSSTMTISNWATTIYFDSDDLYTRLRLDQQNSMGTKELVFTYELVMPDGNHDIYVTLGTLHEEVPCCGTTTPISTTSELYSNVMTSIPSTSSAADIQLTCQDDNRYPMFLAGLYKDATFSPGASAYGLTNVVFLKEKLDGTGHLIIDNYDVDNPTTECADTCYETIDGSALDDDNAYLDGDGTKDECESVPCTTEVLSADPAGDYDSDGDINRLDNCPCSYNPTQTDIDGDGVGNTWTSENGCDNCPDVFNPQTIDMDNNADGFIGTASNTPPYSRGFIDGDVRQTDTDGDGYGDLCDVVEDPCGDDDNDLDGVHDYCDNCAFTDNEDQTDTDGDGYGDACDTVVVDECGDTDADGDGVMDLCDNCSGTANPSQTDTDSDDIGDLCDNCRHVANSSSSTSVTAYLTTGVYSSTTSQLDSDSDGIGDVCDNCPSMSNDSQADDDSDGMGDTCDNCPNNTGGDYLYDTNDDGTVDSCEPCGPGMYYTYDSDGDGIADSCVTPATSNPTVTTTSSLDAQLQGGLLGSCSLNMGGKSEQKGLAILLVLPLFAVALLRRKAVEKIR